MIAISYRREDSLPIAGRLYDRLQAKFGMQNVFMDFDSIPAGVDFRERIKQAIEHSDLVIAVIGSRWLGELSNSSRRIDEPTDFVRLEIKYALEQDIPVIPLLVDDTSMPKPQELPAEIEALAFRNALPLDSGLDFHNHADRLIKAIQPLLDAKRVRDDPAALTGVRMPRPGRRSIIRIGVVSVLAAIVATALLAWFYSRSRSDIRDSQKGSETTARSDSPQLLSNPNPTPQATALRTAQGPPIESSTTRQSPTIAPTPTIESRLIGSWQSSRLYTEYLPDHTFKTIGLYVSGMRWKLNGTTLTQWYPELGDRSPAWYPGAGEMSFEVISIDNERMIFEAKDGRRFVNYRLHGDSELEHEALAQKAKDATAKEQNGAEPPDVASLKPAMEGEAYPQTRMRLLAPGELTDWTADHLQYAINEVYARHGMTFPDKRVQQMFAALTWYRPREELTAAKAESEFSEFERANVQLLAEARRRIRAASTPAETAAPSQPRNQISPAPSVAAAATSNAHEEVSPTATVRAMVVEPKPTTSPLARHFAGTWRGSARSRTSDGSSSTSTYVIRFSEDEKTVWTNWDGPDNGFQSTANRKGNSITWSVRQHPGNTGFSAWRMDCSLTVNETGRATFAAKTVYMAGQFKGITGKVEGTLSR